MAIPSRLLRAVDSQRAPHIRWIWRARLFIWNISWWFRVLRKERLLKREVEQNLLAGKELLKAATAQGATDLSCVVNANLFVSFVIRDLIVARLDMASPIDTWRSKFGSRHMALLIYESSEDLASLLGKNFREAVSRIDSTGRLLPLLNPLCKRVGQFSQQHHTMLDTIRNAVAAHREHDALLFSETIDAIDEVELNSISNEFQDILAKLIEAFSELLNEATRVMNGSKEIALPSEPKND